MSDAPRIGWGTPDGFDGQAYQARFDELEASGTKVHGEADFVMSFAPESVLDAGCGTGRVALELARQGVYVVGVDRDESMLSVAEQRASALSELVPAVRLRFVASDLAGLDLGGTFDVAVMAGNVPLFTSAGTEPELVASVASHVRTGGVLISGFQTTKGYALESYDLHCAAGGLELVERVGTWDRAPFEAGGPYAVSVHRRP
ncbi:MAG: class I SAM-dependent methyltransferase [Acidimicrobiales bacterium]